MSRHDLPLYEFDAFRINPRERLLLRDGEAVLLSSKAFDVLLALVKRGGRLIEKQEFLEKVWPHVRVEEGNIAHHISVLRRTLGSSPSGEAYIATVPGRGYRFVGQVREIEPEVDTAEERSARSTSSSDDPLSSIAVLPLVNSTADKDLEYLSDGITDGIIHVLSQLQGLKVVSRDTMFRHKGTRLDPLTIGRNLGVSSVLSGRALQLADRVVIRMELTDVDKHCDIWGAQFDRPIADLLTIQQEMTRDISEKLRIKLTEQNQRVLAASHTTNQVAHHAYLKGLFYWNQYSTQGLKKGREYFEQAIEADPSYALAWYGLSTSYQFVPNMALPAPRQALQKAKAAATRALALDPHLGYAHTLLLYIKMFCEWDWTNAETEVRRTVALYPNTPNAHLLCGLYLRLTDRFEEAVTMLQEALDLDPLSPMFSVALGATLYYASRNEEAITHLLEVIEMNPKYYPGHFFLGLAYVTQGDYAQAMTEFETVAALDESAKVLAVSVIGYVSGVSGNKAKASEILAELQAISKVVELPPLLEGFVLMGLGQVEEALDRLEPAFATPNDIVLHVKMIPLFHSLRDNPRFVRLLDKIGL